MIVEGYTVAQPQVDIVPARKDRDWFINHAYKCLPLSIANEYGWDLVTQEDISFLWKGGDLVSDMTTSKGEAYSHFGMGTVTLRVGLIWKTNPGVSLIVMPPPNHPQTGYMTMTAVIETDELKYPWYVSLKSTDPGRETSIPAGTVIARVMPITLEKDLTLELLTEPAAVRETRLQHSAARDKEPNGYLRFYHKNVQHKSVKSKMLHRDPSQFRDHILCVEDFLSEEECRELSRIRDETPVYTAENYTGDWVGRQRFVDWDDKWAAKFQCAVDMGSRHFGTHLVPENRWQLTDWRVGDHMPPHDDHGQHKEFPDRHFAGVVYFNDRYDGGATVFPELNLKVSPKKGSLLIFPGGKLKHGVERVTAGIRTTAIVWMDEKNV